MQSHRGLLLIVGLLLLPPNVGHPQDHGPSHEERKKADESRHEADDARATHVDRAGREADILQKPTEFHDLDALQAKVDRASNSAGEHDRRADELEREENAKAANENARRVQVEAQILHDANTRTGPYGLAVNSGENFSRSDADRLGREYVGPGYTTEGNIPGRENYRSADGLRLYRNPTYKVREGKIQANFMRYSSSEDKNEIANGHLDIYGR